MVCFPVRDDTPWAWARLYGSHHAARPGAATVLCWANHARCAIGVGRDPGPAASLYGHRCGGVSAAVCAGGTAAVPAAAHHSARGAGAPRPSRPHHHVFSPAGRYPRALGVHANPVCAPDTGAAITEYGAPDR